MRKLFFSFIALLIISTSTGFSSYASEILPASSTSVPASEPDPATVKSALEEFKSLSRKDRKTRIKEAKKEMKSFKKERRHGQEPSTSTLLLVILCILLPPLAVYLHQGVINNKFWISLLLTLLFWLPGVIYALIVVLGAD